MARLSTLTFEAGALAAETFDLGGYTATSTPFAYSTAQARTGTKSALVTGGAGGEYQQYISSNTSTTFTAATQLFCRACVYVTSFPTDQTFQLMNFFDGSYGMQCVLDSTGILMQDWSNNTTVYNAGTITANVWHVIECSYVPSTGLSVVRLDGVPIASGTVEYLRQTYWASEFMAAPISTCNVYVDDCAVNDNTGSFQNSWCGLGHATLLKPVSDNARVGFTTGSAATTALYAAVSSEPPVGVVQTSATATSQIEDATNNATDYYAANLTTPSAAGAVTGQQVLLAKAMAVQGNSSTTSRTNGISATTPSIASASGATGTTAAATYPTGWTTFQTAYAYAPALPLTTTPVIRFTKGTASADYSMAAFMALLIEYASPLPIQQPLWKPRQAVQRGLVR